MQSEASLQLIMEKNYFSLKTPPSTIPRFIDFPKPPLYSQPAISLRSHANCLYHVKAILLWSNVGPLNYPALFIRFSKFLHNDGKLLQKGAFFSFIHRGKWDVEDESLLLTWLLLLFWHVVKNFYIGCRKHTHSSLKFAFNPILAYSLVNSDDISGIEA